jgi:hypothetical protein
MKNLVAFVSIVLIASAAAAQDCEGDIAALRALYETRQILMRPYSGSYTAGERLDEQMDRMREPLPGGGYRWVRFVKPAGDPPVLKREHMVKNDFSADSMDTFEAAGDHPFGVRIVTPRKRSMFKANNESYIGRVDIRYWVDGREKTMSKEFNQWFAPDTMKTIDLGTIADRAEVEVEVATRNAKDKEALIEVHFKQAVAQDDPANPSYDAIQSLKRVRGSLDAVTLDYEIAKFEKRLFPELVSLPYTTLLMRVREAEKLIRSDKAEEQEKGKKMLAEISRAIQ